MGRGDQRNQHEEDREKERKEEREEKSGLGREMEERKLRTKKRDSLV